MKFLYSSGSKHFSLLPHMFPHIRISPFLPKEWLKLLKAKPRKKKSRFADASFWLDDARDMKFFDSGRSALLACLKHLQLKNDDEVLIITTTQGPYVSSCVTTTIGKVCLWSRKLTEKTKLALVIHEFGFPCKAPEIKECRKKGIPILEDCAYALGSRMKRNEIGTFGDYALYSLTKYFPVPFGGVLVSQKRVSFYDSSLALSGSDVACLKNTLLHAEPFCEEWNRIRCQNWNEFKRLLVSYGVLPYFSLSKNIVPGAFVMKLPVGFLADRAKKRLVDAGIEATEYYGLGGFYFPAHQFLTDFEKQYILHHFIQRKD